MKKKLSFLLSLMIVTVSTLVSAERLRNSELNPSQNKRELVASSCNTDEDAPAHADCRQGAVVCHEGWTTANNSAECQYKKKDQETLLWLNLSGGLWGFGEKYLGKDVSYYAKNTLFWGGTAVTLVGGCITGKAKDVGKLVSAFGGLMLLSDVVWTYFVNPYRFFDGVEDSNGVQLERM